jgi:hypothetical protein
VGWPTFHPLADKWSSAGVVVAGFAPFGQIQVIGRNQVEQREAGPAGEASHMPCSTSVLLLAIGYANAACASGALIPGRWSNWLKRHSLMPANNSLIY